MRWPMAREEPIAPTTAMPAAMSKNNQSRTRSCDDRNVRCGFALMGICLAGQAPKCVFTKQHARMSIFFADEKRTARVCSHGAVRRPRCRRPRFRRPTGAWLQDYSPVLASYSHHLAAGRGGGVGRPLGVIPGLAVGVGLDVAVGVAVGAGVVVAVGVGLTATVGVGVEVEIAVAVAVAVVVAVAVGVKVAVAVAVGVRVDVAVAVAVAVGVNVAVAVGVGVGVVLGSLKA